VEDQDSYMTAFHRDHVVPRPISGSSFSFLVALTSYFVAAAFAFGLNIDDVAGTQSRTDQPQKETLTKEIFFNVLSNNLTNKINTLSSHPEQADPRDLSSTPSFHEYRYFVGKAMPYKVTYEALTPDPKWGREIPSHQALFEMMVSSYGLQGKEEEYGGGFDAVSDTTAALSNYYTDKVFKKDDSDFAKTSREDLDAVSKCLDRVKKVAKLPPSQPNKLGMLTAQERAAQESAEQAAENPVPDQGFAKAANAFLDDENKFLTQSYEPALAEIVQKQADEQKAHELAEQKAKDDAAKESDEIVAQRKLKAAKLVDGWASLGFPHEQLSASIKASEGEGLAPSDKISSLDVFLGSLAGNVTFRKTDSFWIITQSYQDEVTKSDFTNEYAFQNQPDKDGALICARVLSNGNDVDSHQIWNAITDVLQTGAP
jgi:hypothetical protein